jgi:hypothetical protein
MLEFATLRRLDELPRSRGDSNVVHGVLGEELTGSDALRRRPDLARIMNG